MNTQANAEGSAWFWRLFGGAIISAVCFLSMAHVNNINNTISQSRNDFTEQIKDLRDEIKQAVTDSEARRDRLATMDAALQMLKEKNSKADEDLKELQKQVSDLRERVAALSAPSPVPVPVPATPAQ